MELRHRQEVCLQDTKEDLTEEGFKFDRTMEDRHDGRGSPRPS